MTPRNIILLKNRTVPVSPPMDQNSFSRAYRVLRFHVKLWSWKEDKGTALASRSWQPTKGWKFQTENKHPSACFSYRTMYSNQFYGVSNHVFKDSYNIIQYLSIKKISVFCIQSFEKIHNTIQLKQKPVPLDCYCHSWL